MAFRARHGAALYHHIYLIPRFCLELLPAATAAWRIHRQTLIT